MRQHFRIDQLDSLTSKVIESGQKLIYVAGASASGKSYCANLLKESLEKKGHKVLALSSDSYYVDNTRLKHMIYGTFDHPKLIRYDELGKDIKKFLATNEIKIPEYSFVESRRVGAEHFSGEVDYIIVEGLYTISSLQVSSQEGRGINIFVDSPTEELIMRRLIRDQERTQQGVDAIIGDVTKVFPMWNIYGLGQRKKADFVIDNDYEILDTKGEKNEFTKTELSKKECGKLISREYMIDYEYNDKRNENGVIVISEAYKNLKKDLEYVMVSKRKTQFNSKGHTFTTISMKSTQLWIITQLHMLMQLSWMKLQRVVKKTISMYEKDGKKYTIKERRGKRYIATTTE